MSEIRDFLLVQREWLGDFNILFVFMVLVCQPTILYWAMTQ